MFRYDRSSPASPTTTAPTDAGRHLIGLVGGDQALAVELAPCVGGGEHEERSARVTRRGVCGRGRGRSDDPVRVDREPALREPAGKRLAVELREVRHDAERDAAILELPDGVDRAR